MSEAYRTLRESAALIDLSSRTRIRVSGEDRVRLLHAMVTNHVEQLTPGTGCYAFFLDSQGRIQSDVNILCEEESLLLDAEPEVREKLYAYLDRYIIADDVTLEDVTDTTAVIAVEGPKAADALKAAGAPMPSELLGWEPWDGAQVVRASVCGGAGWWVISAAGEKDALVSKLGLPEASADDVRVVRLENGHPRYGEDITDTTLPQETQLLHAIHASKGCYLGQEIVERIRARGHVNKLLVRLRIEGRQAPEAGAKLTADGTEAGQITSAAWSEAEQAVVALGVVRAPFAGEGKQLQVGEQKVEVLGPPVG